MSSDKAFGAVLRDVYRDAPCQVLPNALWKTRRHIDACDTRVWAKGARVTGLLMRSPEMLHVYWRRARDPKAEIPVDWASIDLALLHQDFVHMAPAGHFDHRTAYFRLIHRGEPAAPSVPEGFHVADARPALEAEAAAALIDACYPSISPTVDDVRGWTDHPVFDPALWIWIKDTETGDPAALGIAEFDPAVYEGSLEWIQVLPRYQRRGLGTALVRELLTRLDSRADFTTVGGRLDSGSDPEALYRRCGFTGEDVWWVLAR